MMNYREPLFRPPAEADSLIFQVAYGCPHNSCRFCMMYKTVRYQERPLEKVLAEIKAAGRRYADARRVFLADGEVMFLDYSVLKLILTALNQALPRLARVNVYANGTAIMAKTAGQLRELRDFKLNTLYLGLETGDQKLLDLVNKRETVDAMVAAVRLAQDCGLKCSVMALLGLAGKNGSAGHAQQTAEALNRMQPRLLSFLRFIEVPGVNMFPGYEAVTEYEAVRELRQMLAALELERTVFRANHSSNPAPLEGRFPQDKQKLLEEVDGLLRSSRLDRQGPGHLPFWL